MFEREILACLEYESEAIHMCVCILRLWMLRPCLKFGERNYFRTCSLSSQQNSQVYRVRHSKAELARRAAAGDVMWSEAAVWTVQHIRALWPICEWLKALDLVAGSFSH